MPSPRLKIVIPQAQLDALRARSSRTGTPVSEIVRRAVAQELGHPTNQVSVLALLDREFIDALTPIQRALLSRRWVAEDARLASAGRP